MATSILQRATGIAMYAGTVLLAIWLGAAALGPNTYASVMEIYSSLFGKIILFGYTWAIMFHMLNGIKYLFADAGKGFEKSAMNRNAWMVTIGSILLTAIIWGVALATGA